MIDALKEAVRLKFDREMILEVREQDSPVSVTIASKDLLPFCRFLHAHDQFYFDLLNCVTGIDNGAEAGTMEVIYNLTSIPFERSIMVRVILERDEPVVASLSGIWKTANWLERETYDLLGIRFENHPDLRRILLPADWEGYPLRKDYAHQETYHGIKVKY